MPCYKGQAYLPAAIESCLTQTYTNFELICVDDKSPDDGLAVLHTFAARDARIRIVERDTNGGQGRAFQSGLEVSQGEFVTRLAQDDVFYPRSLERLVQAMQEHPEAGLVYGDMQRIDIQGRVLQLLPSKEPSHALFPNPNVGLYVMWRRAVHQKVGGFTPDTYADDYDLWLRISLDHKLYRLQTEPGVGFREHEGQASHRQRRWGFDIVKAHVAHHRSLVRRSPYSAKRWIKLLKSQLRLAYMLVTPLSMHEGEKA